jgi:hypothetical protein
VQLDVQILEMDPIAWDQPVTAAWADLSPKACENKCKVTTPEVTSRFCAAMKAQHVGKLIAEPRMVTFSGQPTKFLSGGQQVILTGMKMVERPDGSHAPEFETAMMPFGINMTFVPVVDRNGLFLQCDCELGAPGKVYRVTIESEGGQPIHKAVLSTDPSIKTMRVAVCLPECGKSFVMHCGRNAGGKDVMMMVTPRVTKEATASAPPMPASYWAVPPMAASAPVCPLAPMPVVPCTAAVPPVYEPQLVTGQFAPAGETQLDRLMAGYREVCAAGDAVKARVLAEKCLAIDPTCFGK